MRMRRQLCLVLAGVTGLTSLTLMAQSDMERDKPGFGQMPMVFEPNRGQAPADVEFLARAAGYFVFLEGVKTQILFPSSRFSAQSEARKPASRVVLALVGAVERSQYDPGDALPGKSNYYIGNRPSNWIVGVPQYDKVVEKGVYPGVDLLYYGTRGNLEYDFVLGPGSEPQNLVFRVDGGNNLRINESGDVLIDTQAGTIQLRNPIIYQQAIDGRKTIYGRYILRSNNEVGLDLAQYDKGKPLVVDPVLSFSTLIGANGSTQPSGIAVDSSESVYVTGTTSATNYPTVNAFQATNNGTDNLFITKLNAAGNKILYSTYLGGGGQPSAAGIAVDATGAAYITGVAGAANFPVTPGAFMTSCPSICNTPFVTKILADGTLSFSTFMGGSDSPAAAIAVDSSGEAYIAGTTGSNDMPTTPDSFEPGYPGTLCTSCNNGYVEKLNSSGTALVYSTYFGGISGNATPPSTAGAGIAVDSAGSAYLVGNTTAIPLKNPIQSTVIGGPNAFIAKFSPDGSTLLFSTYLGGTSPFFFSYAGDFATGVAVDSNDNVHVVGTSSSCEFPLTLNALSTDCVITGYDQKVFALVLDSSGTKLLFSTFLQSGFSNGITVDSNGNTYVTGSTTSSKYPLLNAIESTGEESGIGSIAHAFASEFDLTGKLLFSTYLTSTYGSVPAGIAVDGKGNIYLTGQAQGDFPILRPIPSEVFQSTYYMYFISKIAPSNVPQFSLSPRVSPVVALRNVSSVPLSITSIVPSPNFTMGGNCGTLIPAGQGCELILLGADDKRTHGTVTIASNVSTAPQTYNIRKSPTGDALGYSLLISPTYVQFPPQLIGTKSAVQQIVIQNTGLPTAINDISMIQPAAFSETNNCHALLQTGASCTISVTYLAASAQDLAQLAIIHDPNQTRDTAFLNGIGSNTAIALSTPSLEFGSQFAGAPALGRIVNLVNATSTPATITAISPSTGYAEANTCSKVLPAHANCRVSVSFSAAGNQDAPGTLTISNYGPGAPETMNLHATGIKPGDLALSPSAIDFQWAYIGIGQNPSGVTVTNNSSKTITIQSITTQGPFPQTNTCSGSIGPGASCQISVGFKPTIEGPVTGSLQVNYVGIGSPQTINLSGTGVTVVQFYPVAEQFGQQLVNTSSAQLSVGIDNYGSTSVNLGTPRVQGSDFSLAGNHCGSTLGRNVGCSVDIVFTPSAKGLRTGTVSIMASDYSNSITAPLQGTGISAGTGVLSVSSIAFSAQKVGTTSATKQITLTNTGTGPLGVTSVSASPQFSVATTNCNTPLAAGSKCMISVTFDPTVVGILAGTLSVQDDGANGQHSVILSGTGQ